MGDFFDDKRNLYKLIKETKTPRWSKESEREEILFYRGSQPIDVWDVTKIRLNLLMSKNDAVKAFFYDFLKYYSAIKECLQKSLVNDIVLRDLWDNRPDLREDIVKYQDLSRLPEIVEELDENLLWIFFTQNAYRQKPQMNFFRFKVLDFLASFLCRYLDEEELSKSELVYGELRSLIIKLFDDFYSEEDKEELIKFALKKNYDNIESLKAKIVEIDTQLAERDKMYELVTISQKVLIQEQVEQFLEQKRRLEKLIEKSQEKVTRIENYFKEKILSILKNTTN